MWYNPCYIAPKRTASSLLMLAVNLAVVAGGGVVGRWAVCQKPNLITQKSTLNNAFIMVTVFKL